METLRTNPSAHQLALETADANDHVVQMHVEFITTNEAPQGYQVWIHGGSCRQQQQP